MKTPKSQIAGDRELTEDRVLVVSRYTNEEEPEWNRLVDQSRNGTFLFRRSYMDYHRERFNDHSLVARDHDEVIAVLPAHTQDSVVYSHHGLTYGGWVISDHVRTSQMLQIFELMLAHYSAEGMKRFVYKSIPYIYHRQCSQEDLYALFRFNAVLTRRDIATVVTLAAPLEIAKGRRGAIRKAERMGLVVRKTEDVQGFYELLKAALASHAVMPVHSENELSHLLKHHPNEIKIYGAFHGQTLMAGALIFITPKVVHTQYLANSPDGRSVGALDLVIHRLISSFSQTREFFSFGTSNENGGRFLNEGLVQQKEWFGGRGVSHDHYELDIRQSSMRVKSASKEET